MSQSHIQKQILYKAIKDPIFAKDIFSQLPTKTFDEEKAYPEIALLIQRHYQTKNEPLSKEALMVLAEDRMIKQNASIEKQQAQYEVIANIYTVDPYNEEEESIQDAIQKYIRGTLSKDVILQGVTRGNLEDEDTLTDIINRLQQVMMLGAGGGGETINFFRDTEKKEQHLATMNKNKFSSGFASLDSIADGGLSRGELGLINASYGSGKAQPNYAPVKTPKGNKRIGSLKVGDTIFNHKGGTQKVNGVFPQGKKKVFEVEFSDGTIVENNDQHLWTYQTVSQVGTDVWEVKTLRELLDTVPLNTEDGQPNIYIPKHEAVEYEELDLLVEPYLLGTYAYHLDKPFEEFCLLGSITQRKEILRGIFQNTDLLAIDLKATHTTKSHNLAYQIKELALSVGYSARVEEDTQKGLFHVTVAKGSQRAITAIRETNKIVDMTCISVSGEDKLYMTNSFIVTHNTTFGVNLAYNYIVQGLNVLFIPLEEKLDRMILRFEQRLSMQPKQSLMAGGQLNKELFHNVQKAYKQLVDPPNKGKGWGEFIITKYMPRTLTPAGLEQEIINQTLVLGKQIDVVIIDYPDLMDNPFMRGGNNEHRAGGMLIEDIRRISQEYDFVGWIFSQLNRSGTSNELRTAQMIEGSKQKLNPVEIAMTINQTPQEQEQNFIRLYVDKLRNRTHANFDRQLVFRYVDEYMQLRDITEEERYAHQAILATMDENITGYQQSKKKEHTREDTVNAINLFNQTVQPTN